jgi:hypothetical protein
VRRVSVVSAISVVPIAIARAPAIVARPLFGDAAFALVAPLLGAAFLQLTFGSAVFGGAMLGSAALGGPALFLAALGDALLFTALLGASLGGALLFRAPAIFRAPVFGTFGGPALISVTLGAIAFRAAIRDGVGVAHARTGRGVVARAVVVAHAIVAQLDGLFAKINPAGARPVIPTAIHQIRGAAVIVRARIGLDARWCGLDRHHGIVVDHFAPCVRHAPGQGRRERGADTEGPEPSPHAR